MNAKKLSRAFKDYDSPYHLYRSTYKYTDCGPSVGMTIDNKNIYCDDLPDKWEGDITAIHISSIVEGVDWGTETHTINFSGKSGVRVKTTWQARFRTWIGASKLGVMFLGARKNARGDYKHGDILPQEVIEFLGVKKINGRWVCPDFKNLKNFEAKAKNVKVQRCSNILEVKFVFSVNQTIYRQYNVPTLKEISRRYWQAVEDVNKEANDIWMETHGCDNCAELYGIDEMDPATWNTDIPGIPVHKDCPNCKGQGVII